MRAALSRQLAVLHSPHRKATDTCRTAPILFYRGGCTGRGNDQGGIRWPRRRGTRPKAKHQIVKAGGLLPEGYEEFLSELKERIRTARLRASLAANRELIALYWHIGRSVVEKQKTSGWGHAVIAHLGDDLQKAFPGESGFSRTNVYRMRALFLAYQGVRKSSHNLWDKSLKPGSRWPLRNSPGAKTSS